MVAPLSHHAGARRLALQPGTVNAGEVVLVLLPMPLLARLSPGIRGSLGASTDGVVSPVDAEKETGGGGGDPSSNSAMGTSIVWSDPRPTTNFMAILGDCSRARRARWA